MSVRMWNHLSTIDFETLDRDKTLVILPLGSTEQHGPHLPVGTDYLLVEQVVQRVKLRLDDLDALLLPALWCTKSDEHHSFAGSLYLRAETMMAMLHDIVESISGSGFKRLVLLNWHGGNSFLLGVLARDLRMRHRVLTFVIDMLYLFPATPNQTDTPPNIEIHAGRYETAVMLAAHPTLVKPGSFENIGSDLERGPLAASFADYSLLLPEGGPVCIGWETTDLTKDGVIGNPAGANVAEGERHWSAIIDRVEAALREIATFEYKSPA